VASVLRQLVERGIERDEARGQASLQRLTEPQEQALMTDLTRYPEVVEAAALAHEPHQLAHFLREVANDFHVYYTTHQFLVEDPGLRDARLNLIRAVQQVLANGLGLLGVSAPEVM
jgi:arginyl-tRNA synthetase